MTVQTDIAAVEAAFSKLKAYVSEEVATAIHDLIVALGIKQASTVAAATVAAVQVPPSGAPLTNQS